jgi:aspartyl-tRNA(Asn)/glutamyl-tRNA(Gln) amidotransferase subunit C
MQITPDEIKHLTLLARIKLARQEFGTLAKDLQKIVDYVGELSQLDTQNVEPLAGGTELVNRVRLDKERVDSFKEEDVLLEAAPQKEDNYFKVPRILE